MLRIRIGAAALTFAVMATGCSSSNNATGTAGSSGSGTAGTTGVAGTGGSVGTGGSAGTSGTTGSAASTGDGGAIDGAFTGTLDAGAPYAMTCAATVRNKGNCTTATDVSCANTCGPNR